MSHTYTYTVQYIVVTFSFANEFESCVLFHFVSDFVHERNRLAKDVFPVLQSYCQHKGLEFQVIDMRWGVRDENISLHLTSDVCIQEIRNCQRLSLGPSFLVSEHSYHASLVIYSTEK